MAHDAPHGDGCGAAKQAVPGADAGRAERCPAPTARTAGLVSRPRLLRRLEEAREIPLVLVVAPAGYGKTTLLTEWAAHDPRPFAWVRPPDMPATDLKGLREHVERMSHPSVLMIDDAHAIRDAEALAVVQAIAEAMPAGSQLALAGRGEPALAVGRLRAHRKLVELRTEDLAMDRSEAATLLDKAGLRLSGDDLDALLLRTEGWPAALYLAALSVAAQADLHAAVAGFAGDDLIVADYLRDEFLAPLGAGQVEFLVRTSVLDTLSAGACDAVLEDKGSATALAGLARSNALLVGSDRTGESYRHHRLFREMLRAELRRTEPELEPALHRRAAAWHARRGDTHAAVRHSVAAGDVEAAAHAIWSEAADRIADGDNERVRAWLAELTPEQIAARPRLTLAAAASSFAAGDGGQVERLTAAAAGALDGRRPAGGKTLHGVLAVIRSCGGGQGVAQMGADASRAARAGPDGRLWRSTALLLEGVACHLTGRSDDARGPLEEGGRGGAAAAPSIQVLCLAQLVLLAVDDGDWDGAAVLAARARSQLKAARLERYPTAALVFAMSALVRAQRGMAEEARGDLAWSGRLLDMLADFMPWYEIETRIVLARAALCLGDLPTAGTLLSEASGRLRDAPDATTLSIWVDETRAELDAATASAGESCALTQAEVRVLRLLPTHLSVPAIANRLYVSPNTVKTHVRAVYRKLDASSRAEAVARASAAGLLDDAQAA